MREGMERVRSELEQLFSGTFIMTVMTTIHLKS